MLKKFYDTPLSKMSEKERRFLPPQVTVLKCVETMQKYTTGCLVLVESNKPVGIFTERDYLIKMSTKKSDILNRPISEYMTPNPITLTSDKTIRDAFVLITEKHFRHIIVVNQQGELKNVISLREIIDFMAEILPY